MNSPAHAAEVHNIAPFWTRLPQFFRYPLHVEPLLYSLLLSAATVVGMVLPLPLAFFLVQLGVWLAFVRYAYKVLDQIRQRFAEIHYPAQPTDLSCSFSAGVVQMQGEADSLLMASQADEALYRAKNNGRNQVQRFHLTRPIATICS